MAVGGQSQVSVTVDWQIETSVAVGRQTVSGDGLVDRDTGCGINDGGPSCGLVDCGDISDC